MRRISVVPAILLAFVAGACRDPLTAENLNNPDIDRVFAQPASIEQALGSGYQVCRNTAMNGDGYQQMSSMAWENGSALNNFSMGPRSGIPRSPILNNKSAGQALNGTYSAFSRQARLAGNTIARLDVISSGGPGLGSVAANLRARAFGFFTMACNLGNLALMYDSAGIVSHLMRSDSVPPLSGYPEVMVRTLAYLDSAIAMANNPASTAWPSPSAWMQNKSLSKAEFIQLMRTNKARYRANVARTPAERAAVNWAEVIADANAGITSTIEVGVGGTTGWSQAWNSLSFHQDQTWHQMPMFYYGFADVSGGFDAWLAVSPPTARSYFLLITPDLRWPQGSDRAAQRASSAVPGSYNSRPYLRNRPTTDSPSGGGIDSYYEYVRYVYIRNAGGTGTYPEFMPSELTALAAEGYIRTGQIELAAQKIDATRVARGGLPALAGTGMTATSPVPGGANCVPRVPQPPNFNTAACGTILEAMKYEYRMELAFNYLGAWFYPMRGWGDLAIDTPLQYPVPVQELDTRFLPYYNLGGGGPSSAVKGTYGYP